MRGRETCFKSSAHAIGIAKRLGTRLHVLHITTAEEVQLFKPGPITGKQITAEACVHHLHFSSSDYARLGNQIKCNPSIKEAADREAIWFGLLEDRIDIIATDHAPHTWEEKQSGYWHAPAGLPLVQHGLQLMLQKWEDGKIALTDLVRKMCHAPLNVSIFKIEAMYVKAILLIWSAFQSSPMSCQKATSPINVAGHLLKEHALIIQ